MLTGVELSASASGGLINVAAGYEGDVVVRDCQLGPGTSYPALAAAAGHTLFRNSWPVGGGGRALQEMVSLTGSGRVSYDYDSAKLIDSHFQTDAYSFSLDTVQNEWTVVGSGTMSVASGRMSITCPSTNNGVKAGWRGYTSYAAAGRVIRIRFMFENATGDIRLVTSTTGSPYVRTVGAFGNGAHDITYELTGDEIGVRLVSDIAGSRSADVVYFTVEHVA